MLLCKTNEQWEKILTDIQSATKEKVVLPVTVSYRIIKNQIAIEKSLMAYRMTVKEIIDKYSDGKGEISQKDNPDIFRQAYDEISIVAHEITEANIVTVSVSEFENKDFPLSLIANLSFMITD
ncbi:MAG: hypothetical protein IJU14_01385 [Clostridia bacterium]|nr:hypothetical protein [Clostridia bacterium]